MDWLYALAGGAYAGGDAYGKEKAAQRDWRREQVGKDAEYVRKENFARFGVDIEKQKGENKSAIAVEEYKKKGDYDTAKEKSGYYDPQTKNELTNEELKERGNAEGLIPKADWEAKEKDRVGQESRDRNITAEEDRVIKAYGKDSEQHKQWKAKALGVPKEDTRGQYTERDIIKDESGLRKAMTEAKKEYGTQFGPKAADAIATLETFRNAPEPVQKAFAEKNEKRLRQAQAMENIAKKPELAEKSPKEAATWLETQYPDMTAKDREAIIEMAQNAGTVGDPKWFGLK